MATKPAKRILDWASGGTATDPGGAKEAAGWIANDWIPAEWLNWIYQSFGDWLTYFETWTDESVQVASAGLVEFGATPAAVTSKGIGYTPTTSGNTGIVTFDESIGTGSVVTVTSVAFGVADAATPTATWNSATELYIDAHDVTSGSQIDLTTVTGRFHFMVVKA